MAVFPSWLSHRPQHSGHGPITRDAISLKYRAQHTHDDHTGHSAREYGPIDEAFTRLEAFERPSASRLENRMKGWTESLPLRRDYARKANWAKHYKQCISYEQSKLFDGQYGHTHPGEEGQVLTDVDKLHIGPNREDVWNYCWERLRVAVPRDRRPMWFSSHVAPDTALVTAGEGLEKRAKLIMVLPKQEDAEVRDDFWKPEHWKIGHNAELRDFCRLSCLGEPEDPDNLDTWHTLAKTAYALSSEDDDFVALCGLIRAARDQEETYPVWTDAPTTLPELSIRTEGKKITVLWTGTMPAGTQAVMTIAVGKDLSFKEIKTGKGSTAFFKTMANAGRAAVLLQHERSANVNQTNARTAGTVQIVDLT